MEVHVSLCLTKLNVTMIRAHTDTDLSIYLVGFPDIKGDLATIPIATMIKSLIPKARVLKHTIFRDDISKSLEDHDLPNEIADMEEGCRPDSSHLEDNEKKDVTSKCLKHSCKQTLIYMFERPTYSSWDSTQGRV